VCVYLTKWSRYAPDPKGYKNVVELTRFLDNKTTDCFLFCVCPKAKGGLIQTKAKLTLTWILKIYLLRPQSANSALQAKSDSAPPGAIWEQIKQKQPNKKAIPANAAGPFSPWVQISPR